MQHRGLGHGRALALSEALRSGIGSATSKGWTTPYYDATKKTYAPVWALRAAYSECDYKNKYVRGYIRKDSGSGTVILLMLSRCWHMVERARAAQIVAQAYKGTYSSSYYGTPSTHGAFYRLGDKKAELAATTDSGTVDCKNNFWGDFPGFDKRLTLSRTSAIDYQGFVGRLGLAPVRMGFNPPKSSTATKKDSP